MNALQVSMTRELLLERLKERVENAKFLMAIKEGELWINVLYELQQAKEISDTLAEYDTQQLNLPLKEEKNNG